jgi:hypothetical protein
MFAYILATTGKLKHLNFTSSENMQLAMRMHVLETLMGSTIASLD